MSAKATADVVWPPDWRLAQADALEAKTIRLGLALCELDELEALLGEDDPLCIEIRGVAGRVRTHRNQMRDEAAALRGALAEMG